MPIKAEREGSGAPECQLGKSKVRASPLAEIFYFSGPIRKANAFISAIRANPCHPWFVFLTQKMILPSMILPKQTVELPASFFRFRFSGLFVPIKAERESPGFHPLPANRVI